MYANWMIPTLVFDIETIPDADGIRSLLALPELINIRRRLSLGMAVALIYQYYIIVA